MEDYFKSPPLPTTIEASVPAGSFTHALGFPILGHGLAAHCVNAQASEAKKVLWIVAGEGPDLAGREA